MPNLRATPDVQVMPEATQQRLIDWVKARMPVVPNLPMPAGRMMTPGTLVPAVPRWAPVDGSGRIRVGIVSPCCGIGGAERHISDMLDHCDGSRIQWVGAAIRYDPSPPNLRADWEAHCPVGSGEQAIASLARSVDVLYTWGVLDLPWGISPSRLAGLVPAGLPIITCSQGSLEYESHMDPAAISAAIPVAVSKAAVRSVPRVKRDQTRIIYNLAAPARGRSSKSPSEIRASLGIPEGVKIAGWMGRLSPEKGPWNYAQGIAALPDGWCGVMAGNGAEGERLAELAARLPKGKLRLIGPRGDMGDLLAIYECLLMVSFTEGCSLAAGEALTDGVPLVSTRVGLLEDHPELARLLPDNPTGEDIARAVLADQADVAGTAARVAMAREFARNELGVDRFAREWTDLLCEVAGTGVKPVGGGKSVGSASMPPSNIPSLPRTLGTPAIDPKVVAAVNACPARGGELPMSDPVYRRGCCGGGVTRWECTRGLGSVAGKPSLADCCACSMSHET